MARYEGLFMAPANYEPLIAAPFDARELVEARSDLLNPATWETSEGRGVWTYVGMKVVVSSDVDVNKRGLYILINDDFTKLENWRKCADETDIARLYEELENIQPSEGGSNDVVVNTVADLPLEGDENATYYVLEDKSIRKWNLANNEYIVFGDTDEDSDIENIKIIYGGDSNGND